MDDLTWRRRKATPCRRRATSRCSPSWPRWGSRRNWSPCSPSSAAPRSRWTNGAISTPIIVHSAGGWEKDIPTWMFPQIIAERVEIVTGESPYPIVGPTEIAAVMMPAAFAAPLDRDAA